jgi:glycerol-3-phosphate cytidylyltransferase
MKTKTILTKIVLLQGAFEIINWGHIKAFEEAKRQGTYLIIALNTDKLLTKYKDRKPVLPYWQKKFILESCKYVDKVIQAPDFSPMKLLKKHKVDVYCLTREWKATKTKEMAYMKRKGGKIHFLPRYKGVIPTSAIKRKLLQEYLEDII